MSKRLKNYYLTWRRGRATPDVTPASSKRKKKPAGGPVVARRKATQNEVKQILANKWVTTRKPGSPNMKSTVRRALAARQTNPKTDDGTKSRAGGSPR